MEEDRPNLPTPTESECLAMRALRVFVSLFSRSFYLFLFLSCAAVIGGVAFPPYVAAKIVWTCELLLGTTILVRASLAGKTLPSGGKLADFVDTKFAREFCLETLKFLLENSDVIKSVIFLTVAYLIAELLHMVGMVYRCGALVTDISLTLGISLLFPLSAVVVQYFQKQLLSPLNASATSLKSRLTALAKNVELSSYSYLSCYAGFTCFFFLLSYLPHGIGFQISAWLNASMLDAKMNITDGPAPAFQLLCATGLFLFLVSTFRQSVVRFSAGYQLFLKRLFIFSDSFLDAFRATVRVSPIRVEMPERHPHLKNALSSLMWVSFCYVLMFALVVCCPGSLGAEIKEWLQSSLRDAHTNLVLHNHLNLLVFIGSVVAAYATMPVAVMGCTFLPAKKFKFILASTEGILSPCESKTLLGFSPIISWDRVSRISLEKAADERKRYLKISVHKSSPIKLKVAETQKESIAALLTAADEYSKKCLIEKPVLDLRQQMIDETKSSTLAETRRFSSTIFSLLKSGDYLKGIYRVVRKLAGKSLSAVYLARNADNELVVIKEFVLPESIEACDRLELAFTREYNLLTSLSHPGIAKVIESFEEGTAKYIVIEHVNGTDLREVVTRSGTRGDAAVRVWALEIAYILSYLHSQSPPVIHRDLTPDNLMIDSNGALKLIDFGASHQFIEGVTGTLIGKQCYIAPEQLRGRPSVESDIYSFGCTLFFLLTGQDPKALQQSDPQSNELTVNPVLRQLILNCTEFEPENRIRSFAEVVRILSENSQPKLYIEKDGSSTPVVETSYGH